MTSLKRDTVTIAPRLSQSRTNEAVYDDAGAVRYQAHVVEGPREVRTRDGQLRTSNVQVSLAPVRVEPDGSLTQLADLPIILPSARLTIDGRADDDGDPLRPQILEVRRAARHNGRHSVEIFAQ